MSIQVAEISQRLQSALDQNYNVADMDTVLQVITQLERIQITKEELETTRLGKYINHLRRKTANESLARRAKNLLKKWREMVLPPASGGAQQQQQIPRDSPAVQQYDGRGAQQQQYYNQNREAGHFVDVSDRINSDQSRYPTSDSGHYRRSMHDTGSNHAPSLPQKSTVAEQIEDCTRYNQFHDHKSNLTTNTGRQSMSLLSSSFSGKSKEPDPYRTLPNILNTDNNPKISISALPKIPKLKNSATSLRLSKHTERSHSPLVNLKETTASPKFNAIAHHDDSSMPAAYEPFKRYPPNQAPSISNGRSQDYVDHPTPMDNNSNSSSINIIEPEPIVPNVSQPSSESVNNEVVKKKHKKHKKDKKSKKHKQSMSPSTTDRYPVTTGPMPPTTIPSITATLELPDSLSSNSMSLFANTSDSIKDQHIVANVTNNSNAFANSNIGTSLPSTSINASTKSAALWTPQQLKSNTVSIDDLTFTGKFTKTDDNIISIDSSSSSNSPKYQQRSRSPIVITAHTSRSSSPARINMLAMRRSAAGSGGGGVGYGSRIATDEENSSNHNISLLQQTETSLASVYGENLAQDDLLTNYAAKTSVHLSNLTMSSLPEPQQTGKKRGRKKGSKGIDSRLGSASNSSHSQQTGAPYYDSISFSSLKNKIDLIRGTTKKVKTTKELLAELQNKKATTSSSLTDLSGVDSRQQSPDAYQDAAVTAAGGGGDENGFTNGKHNSGSRTATPTSPMLSSHSRTASTERNSSKKSKTKEVLHSSDHSQQPISYENETAIDGGAEPKNQIDKEIDELQAKLPPVNKAALVAWRKSNIQTIVCTCKLIEVTDTHASECNANDKSITNDPSVDNVNVPKMLTDCNVLPMPTDNNRSLAFNDEQQQQQKPQISKSANVHSTVMATSTSIPSVATEQMNVAPAPVKKPAVKSIFDLDYDDDDPISFKLNHNNNINTKLSSNRDSNNDISDDKSCDEIILNENIKRDGDNDDASMMFDRSVPINSTANSNYPMDMDDQRDQKFLDGIQTTVAVAIVKDEPLNAPADLQAIEFQSPFRVEEDPDCKAKQFFITSKQSITEFHIEKLHTSYIPNINGNWDEAMSDEQKPEAINENPVPMVCDDVEPNAQHNIESSETMETECMDAKAQDEADAEEERKDLEIEPRITESSVGLYERVVPLCNHITMDRLPKNLNHINLNFGPSDEVEPDVFIASITVEKDEVIVEREPSPKPTITKKQRIVQINDNDESFGTRIDRGFRIYGCGNDIDEIDCGRTPPSPENNSNLDRDDEVPIEIDSQSVEQLNVVVEVDVNVMGGSDDEEESDVGPIVNDEFVAADASQRHQYTEECDNEPDDGRATGRPVIDDDNMHQSQILPILGGNAFDPMFNYNQLESRGIRMTSGLEQIQSVRIRSDEENCIEDELPHENTVSSEMTDSDGAEQSESDRNKDDDSKDKIEDESKDLSDDESKDDDEGLDTCVQEHKEDIHFVTLEDFPEKAKDENVESVVPDVMGNVIEGSDHSTDGELAESVYESHTDSGSSDTSHSGAHKPSDRRKSRSYSASRLRNKTRYLKRFAAKSSHLNQSHNEAGPSSRSHHGTHDTSMTLTSDTLRMHNELYRSRKRSRSPSSTPIGSSSDSMTDTSSSTSSSSNKYKQPLSPKSKKLKRMERDRPCPQHYGHTHTESLSSSNSPMRGVSPSLLFPTSNVHESDQDLEFDQDQEFDQELDQNQDIDQDPDSNQMDTSEPPPIEPVSMNLLHIDENASTGFDGGHFQKPVIEPQQQSQRPHMEAPTHEEDKASSNDAILQPPCTSPPTEYMHERNASLTGNHGNDLQFPNQLPDELFQSDEKDGDSVDGPIRIGLNAIDDNTQPKPADEENSQEENQDKTEAESSIQFENNGALPCFNDLHDENLTGQSVNGYKFKEWHEVVRVKSYNDEILTILPYVVID